MCMICRKDFHNKPKWSQKGDNTLSPIVLKSENLIKIHSIEKGEPAAAQLIQPSLLNWMLKIVSDTIVKLSLRRCPCLCQIPIGWGNTTNLLKASSTILILGRKLHIFFGPKTLGHVDDHGETVERQHLCCADRRVMFSHHLPVCVKVMYKRCMYHQRVLGQSDFSFIFSFVKLWPSCHSEKNMIVYFELLLYIVFQLLILDF